MEAYRRTVVGIDIVNGFSQFSNIRKSIIIEWCKSENYQMCPTGIKRIGWIVSTIVPNNEVRALHIFYKYA